MVGMADNLSVIEEAAKQMGIIIRSLITHSLGDSGYGRAVENLTVMREELIEMEEPGLYNDFVVDLKKKLLAGELGGDRRDMLWEIRKAKLGLIEKKTSEVSNVTEEEAMEVGVTPLLQKGNTNKPQFYSMRKELPHHK
jgi:ATP-dependent DNA helicase 2 subunit 2